MDIEKLSDAIAHAYNAAVSNDVFASQQTDHNGLVAAFLRGEITQKELETDEDFTERPGVVAFDSVEEFETALRMLRFDEGFIGQTLSHEMEHYNTDKDNGFEPRYTVRFFINAEGKKSMIPSVNTKYPHGLSDEELRTLIRKSIEAPEELSDSDKDKLQPNPNRMT